MILEASMATIRIIVTIRPTLKASLVNFLARKMSQILTRLRAIAGFQYYLRTSPRQQPIQVLCLPFGLANTAQAFLQLLGTVFLGLDYLFIYLDDIVWASPTPNQHFRDLLTLLIDQFEQIGLFTQTSVLLVQLR